MQQAHVYIHRHFAKVLQVENEHQQATLLGQLYEKMTELLAYMITPSHQDDQDNNHSGGEIEARLNVF